MQQFPNLKRWRKQNGISQKELSDATNLSQRRIGDLERDGKSNNFSEAFLKAFGSNNHHFITSSLLLKDKKTNDFVQTEKTNLFKTLVLNLIQKNVFDEKKDIAIFCGMNNSILSGIINGTRNVKNAHYEILFNKYGSFIKKQTNTTTFIKESQLASFAKSKNLAECEILPLFFCEKNNTFSLQVGNTIFVCEKLTHAQAIGLHKKTMVLTADGTFVKWDGEQDGLYFLPIQQITTV